ncbi:MAG: multicomponent Na+:H+ antiporter subunit [Clostridia bacterium]|jgi:multicomponent Na+:H+ antiporter subunit F|nr:multicomponent Na+:H+ antiporter subunit [Clostridia bacterium]MDN5323812.1 multicomponent Na+:H+ antiporter subunit [Clostridia bacterium]
MTMDNLFMALIVGLVIVIFIMLFRVFQGPSVYDRLNGLGVIGVDTILLVILIGYLNKRPDMFVDISISYAILGFISLVVIAKYIGGKGDINK